MNKMENNKANDMYNSLNEKGKKIVEMYLTDRQFKNAVLEDEMIILPSAILQKNDAVLKWGDTKIRFRGEKPIIRIYPFIVNKAFACEVYLKLLLIEADFDFSKLKKSELHNLFKLYENTDSTFKQILLNKFISQFGDNANEEFIENEIKNISDVFVRWRYIYEKIDEINKVNYGFLNQFCDFLDRYSQQTILDKYHYNVDETMR